MVFQDHLSACAPPTGWGGINGCGVMFGVQGVGQQRGQEFVPCR